MKGQRNREETIFAVMRNKSTNTADRHPYEFRSRLSFAWVLSAVTERTASVESQLATLAEVEPLLLKSQAALSADPRVCILARRAGLQRIVRLYETWAALAPSSGKATQADEWRQRLASNSGAG
jgi:hypothetical protein